MNAAAACGGGGMDGGDDKKRNRLMPQNALTQKPKLGLSPTPNMGNKRPRQIVKKCSIDHPKVQKGLRELAEAERAVAVAVDNLAALFDQPSDEENQEEGVDDDDKKSTEEEGADKSKGGASGK